MTTFRDALNREWTISLDPFSVGELRDEAKIDLADPSGLGFLSLDSDVVSLSRALAVLLRDQIKTAGLDARSFSRGLVGEAINRASDAVRGAAVDFFPPNRWCEIQSRLLQRKKAVQDLAEIRPILELIDDMPEGMRQGATDALREMMLSKVGETSTDSSALVQSLSVPGPGEIPSASPSGSPDSSGSPPAA